MKGEFGGPIEMGRRALKLSDMLRAWLLVKRGI